MELNYFYIAAIRLNNMGPIRLRRWLEYFHSVENLFNASAADLNNAGLTSEQIHEVKNPNWRAVEEDLRWSEKNGYIINELDPDYPALLKEIPSAPLLLFVQGDRASLNTTQIAMVGSRNPTRTGQETAQEFAYTLAQRGITITSGLALGIDAASHRGALEAQGKTIAVCGSGLKTIYPATNRKLADKIRENGAIISEFPPNVQAVAKHFPMRNRIISGLSKGVLVVEAAMKSGSLITAQFAIDQGREVFAIPGSIHNSLSKGCHQLIRQGAKLVETTGDILEELGFLRAKRESNPTKLDLDVQSQRLLNLIGYEITSLDAIIVRSGLTAGEVSSMLLLLELRGYVTTAPGGYVRQP